MDLRHRGFANFADLVVNRYLDATDNEDGFCLLPFFMAIRAVVRAYVAATQAEEPGQDLARLSDDGNRYFALATRLLEDKPRHLGAIGGVSGSGKTTAGDCLASQTGTPGARVLENGRIRETMWRVARNQTASRGPQPRHFQGRLS